jgi:hypothetical protein
VGEIIEVKWWGEIPRPSGGDIEVNWWGELSRSTGGGNYQGQVVGISRSTGGGNYQGQVVGISRSSSGDIKAKWWGYQGQGEGLRGQGQKKWWGVRALSNSLYSSSAGLLPAKTPPMFTPRYSGPLLALLRVPGLLSYHSL